MAGSQKQHGRVPPPKKGGYRFDTVDGRNPAPVDR